MTKGNGSYRSGPRPGSVNARKRMRRKRQIRRRLVGALLLFLVAMAGVQIVRAAVKSRNTDITLQAENASIKQGEAVPAFQMKVSCDKEEKKLKKKVLDKESGYTLWDLIEDLKAGENCTFQCDADGTMDGDFPIYTKLDESLTAKTEKGGDWHGRVTFHVKEGTLTVQNQVGQWDGDKFKKWDDTYVQNDFVTVKGKTYYFGEDNVKSTGWQEIGLSWYYFDKKGAMQTDQWKKKGESKAYLQADGRAAAGWQELDGNTYYFNQSGEMVTGEQHIGTLSCVFSEKGVLESKESSIDPDKPMMALTFDDGPGDRTPELLDMLEKYDAHATFFMQGVNIPGREDTIKQMLEADCELGNHTYDHPELTKISESEIRSQVGDTNNLVEEACGQGATLVRPPYGAVDDTVKANVGQPMILWNIDTLDWKGDTQSVIDCVQQTADDGDIVLMHDIHSSTVDAALQLIPWLVDQGYQLVTVTEMAEARGITMQAGETYTDFNK